jgi:type IV pilus assembly protein PilV
MTRICNNKGFTLLEVLIAFIILSVGILGAVKLQVVAKKASYDANQRSAALSIANDIIERIRANDSQEVLIVYTGKLSHGKEPTQQDCLIKTCSPKQIAAYDLYQWHKALRMADHTGTLANGVVCINAQSSDNKIMELQVVVAWQGRQKIEEITNQSIVCGDKDEISNRRTVVLDSHIYMRSA